jgi:hypothetical protein
VASSASLAERRQTPSQDIRVIAKELQLAISSESKTLYFHGMSMHPFLVEGDEVVVEPVRWLDIRIGDIVTYRFEDKFPTRRVVAKTVDRVRLWCENWPDRRFGAWRPDVLGRAVARKRDGRWITRHHPEWRAARRAALFLYVRRVLIRDSLWGLRHAAGNLARRLGLRRTRMIASGGR